MINVQASLRCSRAAALVALAGLIAVPAIALAQDDHLSILIERHAQLNADGGVTLMIHIACDPLPGTEDFQEALAGAGQAKPGAAAEGGIDGAVVCDGLAHTYTARLSPFSDAVFKRGPASANATLIMCNVVGDEQVCAQRSMASRIIIQGLLAP